MKKRAHDKKVSASNQMKYGEAFPYKTFFNSIYRGFSVRFREIFRWKFFCYGRFFSLLFHFYLWNMMGERKSFAFPLRSTNPGLKIEKVCFMNVRVNERNSLWRSGWAESFSGEACSQWKCESSASVLDAKLGGVHETCSNKTVVNKASLCSELQILFFLQNVTVKYSHYIKVYEKFRVCSFNYCNVVDHV